MKTPLAWKTALWIATLLFAGGPATAALVPPTGYTNDFAMQPPATDWATFSVAGGGGNMFDLDLDVNATITAGDVTLQTTLDATAPAPAALSNATWSSSGLLLQTRPTGNRYTALMGKFVNNTGTNATQVTLAYLFTITAGGVAEEGDKGTRAYYSLTGLANSWTNLGALNTISSTAGSSTVATNIAVNWTNGGSFYLLWVDDNANAIGTDAGNQFDNFSLQVTAGSPLITDLTCLLTAPTNEALFVSGTSISAAAAVLNGTAPHTVEYFTNRGAGNGVFTSAGSSATPPFDVSLGTLSAGTYNLYAVVTDSAVSPASTNSMTNTFVVADPISLTLTAPLSGATFDNLTAVTGTAMVSGGSAPYAVQFYLDDLASGAPVTAAPYERAFGALFVGDHTIRTVVTDARGWVSNSLVSTVHITGPLGVILTPTNGASFVYGEPVIVTAIPGGGTAPYAVSFYANDQLIGTLPAAPFTVNLGILPVGSYAGYARATDSSTPTAQQAHSSTNVITVLANPLVALLTSPTNGQGSTVGQSLNLAATVTVQAPVTVSNVEFFVDGALAGVDSNAPYSSALAGLGVGGHTVYAVATDSLGRMSFTPTNQVTFNVDPLANNNFSNRFFLTGAAVTVTGNNTGATLETGEPTGGGFGNNRGATLWWSWTAPATGTVRIDTSGSTFDTVLGVYTGTAVNALTQIALNNNAPGSTTFSLVAFTAQQGTAYQIQVAGALGFGGGAVPATGSIQLNLQMPPSIAITAPANGSVFLAGSNYVITANASTPNGPIAGVDFYRGTTLLGSVAAEPFSLTVTNAPAGTNSLTAVVRDSAGLVATSAVVNVLVANLGITITSPADGAVFAGTNPIIVSAFALLPSGAITNVEFFVDRQKFGQDATAPFSAIWSNVVGGSHRLTATALDDAGNSYSAVPVNFGVGHVLVRSNSTWKFLDNGSDQGTGWIAADFDDSGWTNGPAELGYGDGDEATVVASGPAGAFFATTYFRRAFVATNVAALTGLILSLEYDDAAAVYLNGRPLYRTANLPADAAYNTFSTGAAVEDTVNVVVLSATNLVEGTNVLAVEIHQQAVTSSDISFNLDLIGVPAIIRNAAPAIVLTSPTNLHTFLAPPFLTLSASATDTDGIVARVEFFVDGAKLAEDTDDPYSFDWINPPLGPHSILAVATDDQGATQASTAAGIVVYDAIGRPFARITSPPHEAAIEGGTNVVVTAYASAPDGVTNVQFLSNGSIIGSDDSAPYAIVWDAPFGSNGLTAVAFDLTGARGTSAVVSISVFPNGVAATVARQIPLAGATITNLTNITVTFSERVQQVDAGDLLVNGVPATSVTGNGSNYTFRFPHPAYGGVAITWAAGHGITDFGFPADLPFDELGTGAQWSYDLIDKTPPIIAVRTPAAGSTVTNLQQISVTFTELVSGVDAADLLLAGTPAFGLTGSGSNYVFSVSQPPSGTINVTWAANHGITDQADVPNAFNGVGGGAAWNFILDSRTVLVQSNSFWLFVKGTNEASMPTNAWRVLGFDTSGWSNSPAPFFYGDPYSNGVPAYTHLTDMQSNYSTIYLRHEFTVANRTAITNLLLNAQSDDGFIAWLNGFEVLRVNVPAGEVPYNAVTPGQGAEVGGQAGAQAIVYTLTNNAASHLVNGPNVLAVHALNQSLTASSDFGFNAQLYTFLTDAGLTAPRLVQAAPAQGDVLALTNLTVTFSEPVTNVDAGDLLVNGLPAGTVGGTNSSSYTFHFDQPNFGPVVITWAADEGIVDFDDPPKPFDGAAASSILRYTLINPGNPRIASQTPLAGATITNLVEIHVAFIEPVTGVEATDLLVNGTPAGGVSGDGSNFTFTVAQPSFGAVTIRWATNHAIQDLEVPPNDFDPTRFGGQWNYTLVDPVPTVTLTSPTNGLFVLAPATVTVRATAIDRDGVITRVQFFEGANLLGEGTNAPYVFTWSNVLAGAYTFRAVATDNGGILATSAPVSITVVTNLPIVLVRGPYLQVGSPTGGVVRWRTDLFSDALVYYGTDPANLTNVAVEAMATNNHIVRITGLEPDTKYFYSIGSSAQTLAGGTNFWFITSPVPGTKKPTRLWVLGDPGTANNNQRNVRNAYEAFAATNRPADFWLMLGDNAYNSGTDAEHQAAVFDMYPATLRNLFLWPAIGNHETGQSFTANDFPYLHIFSLPQNGEAGGIPSGTERYYSFDYANIHFVCLDSMTSTRSATSPMAQWLQDDLAGTAQEWIIVFFHHPPYTRGNHNSDAETELIEIRQNLLPLLEAGGVDLVLCGHSHAWERSFLLNGHYGNSGTITDAMKIDGGDGRTDGTGAYQQRETAGGRIGTVYTVAGSSGQITGGSLNHPAHFLSLNELGSMIIDVTSNRLDAFFLVTNGASRDHFTLLKPQPPAAPINLTALTLAVNEIALAWTDTATNETGFLLERSLDGTNFAALASVAANVTNALDGGLTANTTYFYRVRSSNGAGPSDFSNIASASTVVPTAPPLAPGDLVASADNGVEAYRSQMVLRWRDRSVNEAGFVIERSPDGSVFAAVGTVGANATHYVDRGLDSATAYYYRVRSFNVLGSSAPSNLGVDMTHPQSDLVLAGASVAFHAGVEGAPPVRYQWRFMGASLFGETNETLVLENVQSSDEGEYNVVVTDATGRLVSNPAYLFVLAPPHILAQPQDRTNLVGSSASLEVVVVGAPPFTYQWRRNGAFLAGNDGPVLTFASVQPGHQGGYDVIVENDFGSVTSRVALLTVNLPPTAVADAVYRFRDENLLVEIADLLANDGDADGDPIALAGVTPNSAQGGTVQITGRYVLYTAPEGFNDADSFLYTIADPRGGFASAEVSITISSNTAPEMAPIPDFIASVMTPLILTNVALDADVPANKLTHSLVPNLPANAHLDANSGLFRWTPTREQAAGTNLITLKVTDDGKPALSDAKSFLVVVRDYVEVTAGSAVLRAGESGSVPLELSSSAGLDALQVTLFYPKSRLSDLAVEPLAPQLAGFSLLPAGPDSVVLNFSAKPGEPLQGTQPLARVHFTAAAGQTSGFVPLEVRDVTSARATAGLLPSTLMNHGRVVVVGAASLLEARLGAHGGRDLILYGHVGVRYTLETSTNPASPSAWLPWQQITPTNLWQPVPITDPSAPRIFYRARE